MAFDDLELTDLAAVIRCHFILLCAHNMCVSNNARHRILLTL